MSADNHQVPIEIRGLTKHFGSVRALDGLDLTVREGEVHGFLGPNGAGKSTTLRILLGLVKADGGSVRLLGGDPWTDAVDLHRHIAYVPGDVTLWPSLTGGETIDLLARMRGGIDNARRAELIERFGLDPTKKARTYSKGNRQKVSLISALSSHATLLLLDEPSSGLDPLMENVFQQCIGEARQRGVTVLLSSHILAETEALCEKVTIIRAGKTVESGSLDALRHLSRTSIKAEMIGDPGDLSRIKGVEDISIEGTTVRAQVDSESLRELIQVLGHAGVRSLVSQPPTLEELFLRHYSLGPEVAAEQQVATPWAVRSSIARDPQDTVHHTAVRASPAHWGCCACTCAAAGCRCRCGCCCCRCRWPPCTSPASKRFTPTGPPAPPRRPPLWPARHSARSTGRSTTTAWVRSESGKPGCFTPSSRWRSSSR